MRDPEYDELPDRSDYRCRRSWCANSRNADRMARFYGELCDDCERRAEEEDERIAEEERLNPECPYCSVRKDEHEAAGNGAYPCNVDVEQD